MGHTMTKKPWMKFQPLAWLETGLKQGLTPEDKGVLIDLMALAHGGTYYGYLMDGGQPIERDNLARTCNMDRERFDKVLGRLLQKNRIASTDGSEMDRILFIPKMVKDQAISAKASFLGTQGGNPALKGGDKAPLILREDIEKSKKREEQIQKAFELFWSSYPRKMAKQKALTAFKNHVQLQEFNRIMAALESHKQSRQWSCDSGQYIPHPTTWLNQHRWEDVLPSDDKAQEYTL